MRPRQARALFTDGSWGSLIGCSNIHRGNGVWLPVASATGQCGVVMAVTPPAWTGAKAVPAECSTRRRRTFRVNASKSGSAEQEARALDARRGPPRSGPVAHLDGATPPAGTMKSARRLADAPPLAKAGLAGSQRLLRPGSRRMMT